MEAARDRRTPVARGGLGRDRGEHGEPERAAELPRGVDEPRGQAGLRVRDARHRRDRHRHERETEPERGQHADGTRTSTA